MRARNAVKLHNGDEVVIKKGKVPAKVLSVNEIHDAKTNRVWVELELITKGGAYIRSAYHDKVC